jgi:transposase
MPALPGVCDERHQTRESRVMDLPMGGGRTELKVRRRQFHCRACDKFFSPRLAALAEGAHATERLLARPAERRALKERFPALARWSEHREGLRQIFDDPAIHTPEEGRSRWTAWCERGRQLGVGALEKFNPGAPGLERRINEIANYFARRSSNGRTEGFNPGIRSILWRAYGMTAFRHFRLRVLHAFG